MGKTNGVTITIKGRTVTLKDKVAIKAGKGCKSVSRTKVKCTTPKKTKRISVALGDKNDWVKNNTSVYLLTAGGTGNDKLYGGSGADQLQGNSGNDRLYGRGGADSIFGDSGADYISAGAGDDSVSAGSGNDTVYGAAGRDGVDGGTGNDRIYLSSGSDAAMGGSGNDTINGDAGDDFLWGEKVNDVSGEPIGSAGARDKVNGGANRDFCHVFAAGTMTGCELFEGASVAGPALAILRG
jgi:Ca2+-binding RTX toxin-like protein